MSLRGAFKNHNQYFIDKFHFAKSGKRNGKGKQKGERKNNRMYEKWLLIEHRGPSDSWKTIHNNNKFARASGRPRFLGGWKVCSINYFVVAFPFPPDMFYTFSLAGDAFGFCSNAFTFSRHQLICFIQRQQNCNYNQNRTEIISKLMKVIMETRELSVTRQMNFCVNVIEIDFCFMLFPPFLSLSPLSLNINERFCINVRFLIIVIFRKPFFSGRELLIVIR